MAIHVVNEARRCLHCKKPMCREGCPINTNIPEVIELFRTGHKEDAGAMLYENNPLSVICSLVCDHDKQCEGHCVLGRKGAPVHFSSIENYISDSYLDHLHLEMQPKTGQRVAIIGSGPAGITISILLAQRGYQVTMFESREKIGGVLRYGIPEFRLPKSILDRYQKQLTQLGIRIRPNTAIGRTLTVDDLQRDGYEAIFIGTGVWKPKAMGIPGESLGNVNYAIDYLVNPDVYDLGDDLVVIVAGYSDEMHDFLTSNPGLISRFNKYIDFPDYTDDELMAILEMNAGRQGYRVAEAAKAVVRGMLTQMTLSERMDFGNARGMRNTLEKLVQAQANRLAACEGEVTRDMLEEITEADAKAALVGEEEQKQADSENVAQLAERGEQE